VTAAAAAARERERAEAAAAAAELSAAIRAFEDGSSGQDGPGRNRSRQAFVRSGNGERYEPEHPRVVQSIQKPVTAAVAASSAIPVAVKRGREMDELLAEMRRRSEATDNRLAKVVDEFGKSTNIFVNGIPSLTEEATVRSAFAQARLGRILSVKIWAGHDPNNKVTSMYVCFSTRKEAEDALEALGRPGSSLRSALSLPSEVSFGGGFRLGWGKPMPELVEKEAQKEANRDQNAIDIDDEVVPREDAGSSSKKPSAPLPLLSAAAADFAARLSSLTPSRADVSAAAIFALDHAEMAGSAISAILAGILSSPDKSAPSRLLAHLYVAADILANAASGIARGSSVFRSVIATALPDAFEALGVFRRSAPHACASRVYLDLRIDRVLSVWSSSSLFPGSFIAGLEATYRRPHATSVQIDALKMREGATEDDCDATTLLVSRCAQAGLSRAGGAGAMRARLEDLSAFLRAKFLPETADEAAPAAETTNQLPSVEVAGAPTSLPAATVALATDWDVLQVAQSSSSDSGCTSGTIEVAAPAAHAVAAVPTAAASKKLLSSPIALKAISRIRRPSASTWDDANAEFT
jgi:hypothetical protein